MTAKEYLEQYLDANREINAKLDEIQNWRELATKTTRTFEGDETETTALLVAKIVDQNREVDRQIDKLVEIRQEIETLIYSLSDHRYRDVLNLRYINGKQWEEIAVLLNYDYRYVLKLHKKALNEIRNRTLNDTSVCDIV
jgi:DNA-directed RNA polymerase specialized sigma subunit